MREQWSKAPFPPREWQREAVSSARRHLESHEATPGVIAAVMGAGKSAVIGELAATYRPNDDRVLVITTPSVSLVHQLASTVQRFTSQPVGVWYGREKNVQAVTVCCMASAPTLSRHLTSLGVSVRVWIADEAHKTECSTMIQAHRLFQPSRAIGFTATPFRASEKEELSLWGKLLYHYTPSQAIQDGVVVPPKVVSYTGPVLPVNAACVAMIQDALDGGEGPGMVNASTVEDADNFVEFLSHSGIRADAVHSRMTEARNTMVIERLRLGQLDCLVHVNMLAEGTNLPWLRWLCLRRAVQSKVRFCQEVGRVLRTFPGKEYGLCLDPNDLFDVFGLSGDYAAVLAGDSKDKPEHIKIAEELDEMMKSNSDLPKPVRCTKAMGPAVAWIRAAKMALKSAGYIEEEIRSTEWRKDAASDKQVDLTPRIAQIFKAKLPQQHQEAALTGARLGYMRSLKKGDLSDLITIGFTIAGKGWPEEADRLV